MRAQRAAAAQVVAPIEIRRPLYMDEATRERHEGFARVQKDLTFLVETLAAYVKDRVA